MPNSLTVAEYLTVLVVSGDRLVSLAERAGMDAPVPSCPTWHVRELLAHQAMVHRWATAQIRGEDAAAVANEMEIIDTVEDLPAYYREGLAALVTGLREAPHDLTALTFLNDAPAPRLFWARRQAHETTMHMVDALAASLARLPTAAEPGIASGVAADGVDELLRGFFTRGKSKLYTGEEYTVVVAPDDVDRRWVLHIGPSLTVQPAEVIDPATEVAATISGTAAGLYLALWNRGDEVSVTGRPDLLDTWRSNQRVRWS